MNEKISQDFAPATEQLQSEQKELGEDRSIKLTYKNLSLDLYEEFNNIAADIAYNRFPNSEFTLVQDNADLAEQVSADEDNDEKNMGTVTLTFQFKATNNEAKEIKQIMDEELDPSIYEAQEKKLNSLFKRNIE